MKRSKVTEFQIFSGAPFKNFRVLKLLSIFSQIRSKFLVVTFSILVLNIGFTMSAVAQDDSEEAVLEEAISSFDDENTVEDDDDVLSGFDDEEDEFEVSDNSDTLAIEESWSSLYGSIGLKLSYSYVKELPAEKTEADWSGFTKMQPFLYLTWDAKLGENWKTRISGKAFYDVAYGMKERENFSKEVLNELEKESEFREVYLEGSLLKSLDIKLGKQIVAWGVANSLRVVDVLNPIDNREFGMTDLEDTRQPISMTRIDYYVGDFKLEAVVVHQIKFNKASPFGSDFNPTTQRINEVIPESSYENSEHGLALIGTFSGWDASLHWAQYFDDTAHFKISSITIVPGVGAVPTYEMFHSRLTMAGMTVSIPSGNFLWKAEAAKLKGMQFANVLDQKFSRTDVLLGTEYSGWNNTTVSIESGVQHLNDFDTRLEALPDSELEDRFATSVSFMQDYLNQTLNLNLTGMMIGKRGEDGGVNRASLEYDVVDNFSVKGGLMLYQPGENDYFQSLNENDRIFFDVRYFF